MGMQPRPCHHTQQAEQCSDILEGRDAMQPDFYRLNKHTSIHFMTFNKVQGTAPGPGQSIIILKTGR